jgi:hypothetical protein
MLPGRAVRGASEKVAGRTVPWGGDLMSHLDTTLSVQQILTLAERESGAFGLADAGLRQRLTTMVDWINAKAPYTPDQVAAMRRQIQHILANRLRITLDRRRYPGIVEEKIERPIFIIGFARSGTTLLHELFAQDPETLAPLAWHARWPSPPPGAGPVAAGRIAYADHAVQEWIAHCPAQLQLHPYADKLGMQLIEDEEIFTLDFRNAYPSLFWKVPSLEVMVVLGEDGAGAYRFHREVLQHLQWNTGKTRWACKSGGSQMHLQDLFAVYPDALCVWAHRPLSEIYASNVVVRAATYDAINGGEIDWKSQAEARALAMKAAIEHVISSALIDDPRIVHLSFRELSADPVATVRKIYGRAGLTVTAEYERRLEAWLSAPENRVDRYGRYPYAYAPWGLDERWVRDLFAAYSERFGLAA